MIRILWGDIEPDDLEIAFAETRNAIMNILGSLDIREERDYSHIDPQAVQDLLHLPLEEAQSSAPVETDGFSFNMRMDRKVNSMLVEAGVVVPLYFDNYQDEITALCPPVVTGRAGNKSWGKPVLFGYTIFGNPEDGFWWCRVFPDGRYGFPGLDRETRVEAECAAFNDTMSRPV